MKNGVNGTPASRIDQSAAVVYPGTAYPATSAAAARETIAAVTVTT